MSKAKRYINRLGRRDGGVAARVIICAASLAVLAGAIVTLLKTFEADRSDGFRRAETISAYGIQVAFGKLSEDFEWSEGFEDEPYPFGEEEQDGSYSVTVTRESRNDTLYVRIVSVGTVGSVSHTQTEERAIPVGEPEMIDGAETSEGLKKTEGSEISGEDANGVSEDTEQ